ncbi:sporulation protein [Variovorax sp. CAN2819]|uniref:sporulation protein n=1 Tax=Variovorax sp. CAN15 TaxID=3046727 RepID=UPI002649AC13|nr:sporulation protein [Variovorax sp. CAN15]MDN6882901.1 sporulation protein [Variovorax sp. CAN15]
MKLRLLLVVLLLANAGYFLWARGDLAGFGLAPAGLAEREPQRMARQIHPEWLQIRKEAPKAAAPAP